MTRILLPSVEGPYPGVTEWTWLSVFLILTFICFRFFGGRRWGIHHGVYVEVERQLLVDLFSLSTIPGIRLSSSGMAVRHLYPLRHLTGPDSMTSYFLFHTKVVLIGICKVTWRHWSWNGCYEDYVEELAPKLFFLIVKLGFRHVICSQHHTGIVCAAAKNTSQCHFLSLYFGCFIVWQMCLVSALIIIGSTFRKGCSKLAAESYWGVVLREMKRCHGDSSDLWT